MGIVVMIAQLILSLSILIVLHELGHFVPAKLFKTRVEKFYLFFDPGFELFKHKIGETEYGIGWLPLGGYVKISGMIDESMDTEQMKQPPQPWEFRSKPAWQRLIIMLGGVTVNFILGFLIYAMVLSVWGEEYLPAKNVTAGIYVDSLGQELGLQNGDHVLAVGDVPFEKFNDRMVAREVVINDAKTLKIRRDGQEMTLDIDEDFINELTKKENKSKGLFEPRFPFLADSIPADGPAAKAGMKRGDQFLTINNQPAYYYNEVTRIVKDKGGEKVNVTYLRQNDTLSTSITLSEKGKFGIFAVPLETARQDYNFFEALPAGTRKGWGVLTDQIKAFGQMFRGRLKVKDSLGGFGSIAKMYGKIWNWENFWSMTAILSLILAFMNLLPIPALDGGHVMFLLYEVVTGRKPSDKFMEYATLVGFILVISLVLYANFLDVVRSWF